jgi:ubiquinone biosynthesis protein UbiJ
MAIKSAYELALERMGGGPGKKLTPQQKAKLAELDRVYAAKIAEEELSLTPKIAAARVASDLEGAQKLEEILRAQVQKLRRKLDAEKEAARQGK